MPPSPPRATYRLQLRNGVDFTRAAEVVPYLAQLGVSHLYLSPPLAATPGSTHGYDVVDPNRLDPALGGGAGFATLRRALDAHGLGLILDIVPNHMGIGRANAWWWDVLRHGRASHYARYFDIDFSADPDGKIVLPVLRADQDDVVGRGDLRLVHEDGLSLLAYGDERFPLAPGTSSIAEFPHLLDRQHYRLVCWREGTARRNYRRFFNIDQLAGLRVEDPEVFEASHRLILDLAGRGLIQGLRVDHVDGLTDPKAYLDLLQRRLTEVRADAVPLYVVVEKILIGDEQLPEDWPIAGTTGYEFMNEVAGVLVDGAGLDALAAVAERITGMPSDYGAIVAEAKSAVLGGMFAGEFQALARRAGTDFGLDEANAADALRQLLINFPVYRTYLGEGGWSGIDVAVLDRAFASGREVADPATRQALDLLQHLMATPNDGATSVVRPLQQLSGPLMAKSVEDTAFYRYHRLLALNEVGGEADSSGCPPNSFHQKAERRLRHWPDTMLATATHDTKRGEDARARLLVLSEVPDEWEAAVSAWRELDAVPSPLHPVDEYAFYQSLVGAWPLGLRSDDIDGVDELRRRLEGWFLKAIREAKERSDWNDPDLAYERLIVSFLEARLATGRALPPAVATFVRRIDPAATANSLAQLLLKLTSPGIPDIYQGTESWDLALVDPDNRRAVDFESRLRAIRDPTGNPAEAKLAVLRGALVLRAEQPDLFARGCYQPLVAEGRLADHVLASGRGNGDRVAITVVTRLLGRELIAAAAPVLPDAAWAETAVVLPPSWHNLPWRDRLGGAAIEVTAGRLQVAQLLRRSPVALVATV